MFSALWNSVVNFFRSATLRGMQLGAQDFAAQFEAEARELAGQPPPPLPPPISPPSIAAPSVAVAVMTTVTKAAVAPPPAKPLPPPPTRPALAAPQSNDGYPVPVKRGRGRPRKNPDAAQEEKGGERC